MTSEKIQEAIIRALMGSPESVARDQLVYLCRPIEVGDLARELKKLVDGGVISHACVSGEWRYRMPPELYRVRREPVNQVSEWHVDRRDATIPDRWHTIVQASEMEALVCHKALLRHITSINNQVAEFHSRASELAGKRKP